MCLAVPARIVEKSGDDAVADLHGNRVTISTVLTPDVALGDWVLVHAGFAIQRLDAVAAAETFAILQEAQVAVAESVPTASSSRKKG
jgi:hydrogenase expression/formation protein HypC